MKNLRTTILIFTIFLLFGCAKEEEPAIMIDPEKEENPKEDPEPTTQQDLAQIDNQIEAFMAKYNLPGGSLAITKNEKLVYAKGFGFANTETEEAMTPEHSLRIASISKTFTATAILKLVEDNKIDLEDKVFGSNGILGDEYGTKPIDQKIYNITVDHLLYNTGGGWSVSSGGDPIDYAPELDHDDFINYVFDNWELKYNPGEQHAYSNTGYYMLARIIEKVSGMDYAEFLKQFLKDTGISSLHKTKFSEADKQSNEVSYYAQNNEQQWVYSIAERRDGDGGLVISAPDLLRFISAIDGFNNRKDILNSETLTQMKTIGNKQPNWGRGMGIWPEQNILYSIGSLPGNRSWLMRDNNGISIALLFNSRADHVQNFAADFQALLFGIVKDNSIPWQSNLDQFN